MSGDVSRETEPWPTTSWTDHATADPVTDVSAWAEIYRSTTGRRPNTLLGPQDEHAARLGIAGMIVSESVVDALDRIWNRTWAGPYHQPFPAFDLFPWATRLGRLVRRPIERVRRWRRDREEPWT